MATQITGRHGDRKSQRHAATTIYCMALMVGQS